MPQQVKLWRVHPDSKLEECDSAHLDLEERLERWIEEDISVVAPGLLVIGRQVETDFGGVIDLLCLDRDGTAVIIELKRDKTPREVTAQVLDYASWVRNLSNEKITAIANVYLGERGPLEQAFSRCFGSEIPDVLNEDHRMIIVGSRIDASTERIIQYLSDDHGVGINAVSFQFFRASDGGQTLARVFLIEPEKLEYQTRTKRSSKRRPDLTFEEAEQLVDEAGVAETYRLLLSELRTVFQFLDTTRSSVRFSGDIAGSRRVIFSLLPRDSSGDRGLSFQVYWKRLCEYLGFEGTKPEELLPLEHEPWSYDGGDDPNWTGYAGYFKTTDEATRFVETLKRLRSRG